jgi:hypothetical protein
MPSWQDKRIASLSELEMRRMHILCSCDLVRMGGCQGRLQHEEARCFVSFNAAQCVFTKRLWCNCSITDMPGQNGGF